MRVYLYPAQTVAKIFPLGGDERFTISADGTKILDAHVMHHAVIAVPAESNVFDVLARTPPMPDYVSAQGELYRINADGSIDYMGAGASPPLHQSRRW